MVRALRGGLCAHLSSSSSSTLTNDLFGGSSGGQIVALVQSAEPRHRYDSAISAGISPSLTTSGCFLRQPEVRSVIVIVVDVLNQEALEMPFVQGDHVVEQILTATPNPTLGNSVLPRALEARSLGLDIEALDHVDHFLIEVGTTIKDQISRRRIVGKCFAQLLNDPGTRRMFGNVPMKDAPPVVRDDEEAVENAEGDRRHREEIHRGDGLTMIAEKCSPSFRRLWIPRCFLHPPQHSSLRKIKAQHL